MKYDYNPERVEKAKQLFSEVLELEEKLPADARVDIDFNGGIYGHLNIWFFERNEEGIFKLADDMPNPVVFFVTGTEDSDTAYEKIKNHLSEWEKRFCK